MLRRLDLGNLTVFRTAEFRFCNGVNVIIGENGSGKSHLLKTAYALLATGAERNGSLSPTRPVKSTLQRTVADEADQRGPARGTGTSGTTTNRPPALPHRARIRGIGTGLRDQLRGGEPERGEHRYVPECLAGEGTRLSAAARAVDAFSRIRGGLRRALPGARRDSSRHLLPARPSRRRETRGRSWLWRRSSRSNERLVGQSNWTRTDGSI